MVRWTSLLSVCLKPNSITLPSSLAGSRPVRDQIPLHCPAWTSSWAGSQAASELDEDLHVHVVCMSQAKFHYTVQLASRSQTSSWRNSIMLSSLRPAHELVADLLASKIT